MKLAYLLLAACGGGGSSESGGAFSLSWAITTSGQSVDCATAGVETILIVTDDGATLITEQFLCEDGEAITGPRAPGTYTIDVTALDATNIVVATSNDQGTAVAGQTVDLGVFPLETDPAACDSSSCPTGCCDDSGACIDPQTDAACGRGGVACQDCQSAGLFCDLIDGICTAAN